MQLKILHELIAQYKAYLGSPKASRMLHLWESQQHFQDQWTTPVNDWGAMYDQALQNSQTRRLWKRENYEPKRMMLLLASEQPDFVQAMFNDLFNEEKSIDGRLQRFVFYCDELLDQYRANHPATIENNHFHDDQYHMASVYLAFRYPDRYTIYDHEQFVRVLQKLGVQNPPKAADFERFAKVARTFHKFLNKDESLLALHRKRLQEYGYVYDDSMLITFDFYQSIR